MILGIFTKNYSTNVLMSQSGFSASRNVRAHFIQRNWLGRQCSQSQPSLDILQSTNTEGDHFLYIFTFTVLVMLTNWIIALKVAEIPLLNVDMSVEHIMFNNKQNTQLNQKCDIFNMHVYIFQYLYIYVRNVLLKSKYYSYYRARGEASHQQSLYSTYR